MSKFLYGKLRVSFSFTKYGLHNYIKKLSRGHRLFRFAKTFQKPYILKLYVLILKLKGGKGFFLIEKYEKAQQILFLQTKKEITHVSKQNSI